MKYLIGIDVGTSSCRTQVFDLEGKPVSFSQIEYGIDSPRPGYAEQDMEAMFASVLETLATAVKKGKLRKRDAVAISFSGQMHGLVALDKQGRPLHPAIIWADQRSAAQVGEVEARLGKKRLGKLTGNPVATGFMLPSLLWLKEKSAGLFRRIKCVLLPKDYIRYRLTGNLGWECSDGSSTLCFDTARRAISEGLLRTFDIPAAVFPPVHESIEIAGSLSPHIAAQAGLSSESVVVMGAGDQQAQALGNGIIKYGLLSSTIGTGGQLFAPLASYQYDPQLRCQTFCHCLPRLWHAQTAILSAGLSLRWLRDRVFGGDYKQLSARAASAPPGSKGLHFVPYLLGERTPHMDSLARAGFAGLSLQHDSADMIRAVFEGVVFAMRDGLEILRENGVSIQKIFASGGAVKSRLWLQLQADIYNSPIHLTATEEAASLGAAMLAGLGSGVYKDAEEAAGICVRVKDEVILPNKADAEIYEERYQQYRKLSPFFVKFFHAQQA